MAKIDDPDYFWGRDGRAYADLNSNSIISYFTPAGKTPGAPAPIPYRDDYVDPDESQVSIMRSVDTVMRNPSVPNPDSQYVAAFDPKSDVWSLNSTQAESLEPSVAGPIEFEDNSKFFGIMQIALMASIAYFGYALYKGKVF